MSKRTKFLEFDDMGLGKSVTTLDTIMKHLYENREHMMAPILILCSTNALGVWQEEVKKWFNEEVLIYSGTPTKRKKLWYIFQNSNLHFLVTTYGVAEELPRDYWFGLICDEIHVAGLLNHKTKTYKMVEEFTHLTPYLYLLTGTPIRKGVIDLFGPLHLVDPEKFRNYWQFVNTYCVVIQTPFGKQIERNPRDIAGFRQLLNVYMIRRLKSDVLKDLPGKQRFPVPIQMTPKQAKAHQDVMTELMYVDADTTVVTPNKMTAVLRARQILVTPRLLGIDDDGAALNYLKEDGEALLTAHRPFVVFTPFRQALPYIHDVIKEIGLGTTIYELHGGMTPAAFADTWQGFENNPSKNKVLLCVIKSGASFHATTAADCYFLGYEWDFNLNVQSEDRLCRLGQENFVNCKYLLNLGDTVDEAVKERINDKNLAATWIIGSEKQYLELLRKVKPR